MCRSNHNNLKILVYDFRTLGLYDSIGLYNKYLITLVFMKTNNYYKKCGLKNGLKVA